MTDLSFEFEWVDPEGARGPELRATWARLTVSAAGEIVTRVLDLRTRGVRGSIYVPLYPIAEWFTVNWWPLLYEVHSPRLSSGNGYESRHCLADASDGFALPVLSFEPMGEGLRLFWTGKRLSHSPLEFLSSGSAHPSREAVQEALSEFVDAVVGRLDDEGIRGTMLQEEWSAIKNLSADEQSFCRLVGALGLDPFQVDEEQAETVIRVAQQLPEELHGEFFSSADPSLLTEEAAGIGRALEVALGPHGPLEELRRLRESFLTWRSSEVLPWRGGYEAARAVRQDLDLDGSPLPSLRSIGDALGLESGALEQEIRRAQDLRMVDGVVAFDDQQSPGFVIRPAAEEARRFTFCRELFEYLTSEGTAPLIVTRGGTYRQQRNRAFAAEFLLPSDALRGRVPTDLVTYQEVNEIAEEFGVSWAVVSHQLENHGIARISPD